MTAPTTAYDQVEQWDQAWERMEMAKPLQPIDDTDAGNSGVQEPGADGGFALPTEAQVNLAKTAPADTDVGAPTPGETVNSPGLNVFA